MRDGVKLFTSVYVPKDGAQTYPILLTRTPYSCRPYGIDNVRDSLGPSRLAARDLFVFVYQDVRGRWMSEGEYRERAAAQATQVRARGRGREHRHLGHDRLAGEARPAQQRQGRDVGHLVPRLLHVRGHDRRAPRAQGASSPQAPITDWFVGDDFHHNGAPVPAARVQLLLPLRPAPARAHDQGRPTASTTGRPTAYRFYLEAGPRREPRHEVPEGRGRVLAAT